MMQQGLLMYNTLEGYFGFGFQKLKAFCRLNSKWPNGGHFESLMIFHPFTFCTVGIQIYHVLIYIQ
jgi:hypothetical protein